MKILSFKLYLKDYFEVIAQNSFNYSLFAIITFHKSYTEENMIHVMKRLSFKICDAKVLKFKPFKVIIIWFNQF